MKYEIKHRRTGEVIFSCETETMRQCVEQAVRDSADLRAADLSAADLSHADLRHAGLRYADLRHAGLRHADLRYADLRNADLRHADLSAADLRHADLRSADLNSANLDFSSGLPFRCSSFDIKADIRLAAQLAYHFCRIDFGKNADAKAAKVALKKLANQFHRVNECGEIE